MSTIRIGAMGTVALVFYLFQIAGPRADLPAADSDPKATVYGDAEDNSGRISAPVVYRDLMLIVVTNEGVAAIVFDEKDPKTSRSGSARYRFRFLKNAESAEVTGTGMVLETANNIEDVTIKAGPIRVGWSGGGHDRGWIYYQPEDMQISIAQARRFNESIVEFADEPHPIPKLDLKRFLKKQK